MKKRREKLPKEKEQLLNPIVGRFNLTAKSKVGTVTDLILSGKFKSIEDWEEFYYESGKLRQDLEEKAQNKKEITKLRKRYGRTEEELENIGKELYNKIRQIKRITEKDCVVCIRQYVIDNTWIGVMMREKNTVTRLKNIYGIEDIKKSSGDTDTKYAVDYEIDIKNSRKIGLQIKPASYLGHDKAQIREQNEEKMRKYPWGDVILIISDEDGNINDESAVVKRIKDKLNEN